MFSGLVETLGEVVEIDAHEDYARLKIKSTKLSKKLKRGDSIAVNGVCLTALNIKKKSFEADVMVQTLNLTALGHLKVGSKVNLELPATPTSFLGGHIVQGHVDGVGILNQTQATDKWWRYEVKVPANLRKFIQNQGSICLDGVSLTVGMIDDDAATVTVWLIPETLAKTNLQLKKIGDLINIEVDALAKYVDRLMMDKESKHL